MRLPFLRKLADKPRLFYFKIEAFRVRPQDVVSPGAHTLASLTQQNRSSDAATANPKHFELKARPAVKSGHRIKVVSTDDEKLMIIKFCSGA